MSESERKWHDLNHEQWTKLFEFVGWREVVARTLYEIARSADARWQDRMFAMQTLNESIMDGKLAQDPGFPELLRDVLLELTRGTTPKTRWFGRARRRKVLRTRLAAARWMLGTIAEFPPENRPTEPEVPAQEVDAAQFS